MPAEKLELWRRDPIECVRELMGNPMFKDMLKYAPEKTYFDPDGKNRIYDEMWSADWWWDTQVSDVIFRISREALTSVIIRENYPLHCSTIAPIILSSDKTQLSHFRGDKSAWPVYLTIGNIAKSTRR
jgi:hypothetical protein